MAQGLSVRPITRLLVERQGQRMRGRPSSGAKRRDCAPPRACRVCAAICASRVLVALAAPAGVPATRGGASKPTGLPMSARSSPSPRPTGTRRWVQMSETARADPGQDTSRHARIATSSAPALAKPFTRPSRRRTGCRTEANPETLDVGVPATVSQLSLVASRVLVARLDKPGRSGGERMLVSGFGPDGDVEARHRVRTTAAQTPVSEPHSPMHARQEGHAPAGPEDWHRTGLPGRRSSHAGSRGLPV